MGVDSGRIAQPVSCLSDGERPPDEKAADQNRFGFRTRSGAQRIASVLPQPGDGGRLGVEAGYQGHGLSVASITKTLPACSPRSTSLIRAYRAWGWRFGDATPPLQSLAAACALRSANRGRTQRSLNLVSRRSRRFGLSPECPTLFGADGVGDQLHEIRCCIERGGVAGTLNLLRSRSGNGRCQRASQADDVVGAPGAVAAHYGDRNIREIGR
jgi:hypothetical protein